MRRLAAFLSFPPYTQRLLQTCNYQPASREPARLVIAKSANCKASGAPLPPFPFCEPATPSPILSHLCTLREARPPRFPFPHTLRVSQLWYLRPAKSVKSANCELRNLRTANTANCESLRNCVLRIPYDNSCENLRNRVVAKSREAAKTDSAKVCEILRNL